MTIANAYAVFANGGYRVNSHLIERVETVDGRELFRARPATVCRECDREREADTAEEFVEAESLQELFSDERGATPRSANVPERPAERIVDARIVWIMDSILKDVIERGTGRRARALERDDIGGKTGTTNGPRDAWFSGYSPHLVTTVWVGFDENLVLGRNEYGGSAALPIWIDFMGEALQGKPEIRRPQPPGIVTVKVHPETGRRVRPGVSEGIDEYFLQERVPPLPEKENGGNGDGEQRPLPEELY